MKLRCAILATLLAADSSTVSAASHLSKFHGLRAATSSCSADKRKLADQKHQDFSLPPLTTRRKTRQGIFDIDRVESTQVVEEEPVSWYDQFFRQEPQVVKVETTDPPPPPQEQVQKSNNTKHGLFPSSSPCPEEVSIWCGYRKLKVCHYNEEDEKFETLCVRKHIVTNHLMDHQLDYCGECIDETTTEATDTPNPTTPAPTPAPEEIFCGSSVSNNTTGLSPVDMPDCGTSNGYGGAIWYKFVGTGVSTTFSTCGGLTDYDTIIRVYKADAANTCVAGNDDDNTCVACNDDDHNCGLQSTVEFTAEKDVEYKVLVHGYGSSQGVFELTSACADPTPPPSTTQPTTTTTQTTTTETTTDPTQQDEPPDDTLPEYRQAMTMYHLKLDCDHKLVSDNDVVTSDQVCAKFTVRNIDQVIHSHEVCEVAPNSCPEFFMPVQRRDSLVEVSVYANGDDPLLVDSMEFDIGGNANLTLWHKDEGARCLSDQCNSTCMPNVLGAEYPMRGILWRADGSWTNILYENGHCCEGKYQCESNICLDNVCQDSLPSCDNAALNPCDPATEVCAQTESGLQCYPKTVCDLLGDSDCTEPFEGFFEELAVQGSFTSTSNEDAIKTWIKEHVWNSLSMDELIAQVPSEYVIAASESSEEAGETESISQLRLNEFLEVLLDDRTFTSVDLSALEDEFNFVYSARHLATSSPSGRVLESLNDTQCEELLAENVVKTLTLCFEAIGVDSSITDVLIQPLVEMHSSSLLPSFKTLFVQQNGLTKSFIASVFISFMTTVRWGEMEDVLQQSYTGNQLSEALVTVMISLLRLFTSGGWTAVVAITPLLSSIFSLYDEDIQDITTCIGDIKTEDCENFVQSGGYGLTSSVINMGQTQGVAELTYSMYGIPDEIEVFYEGERIYWSEGLVSGTHTVSLEFGPGDSQTLMVVIRAPNSGTAWEFELECPESNTNGGGGEPGEITYDSVKNIMEAKGYTFFDGVYDLNLVGIRNRNRIVNEWDDTFLVLYKDDNNVEQMVSFSNFTTDPGKYYMELPLSEVRYKGTAIVAPGQYRSVWSNGLHRGVYDALVQTGDITVYRDNNRDTVMDIPISSEYSPQSGKYGINLHHGYNSAKVDNNSAGCQVFRDPSDLQTVLDLAQKQIDHGHGGLFSYTLLDESDFGSSSTPLSLQTHVSIAEAQTQVSETFTAEASYTSVKYYPDLYSGTCVVDGALGDYHYDTLDECCNFDLLHYDDCMALAVKKSK